MCKHHGKFLLGYSEILATADIKDSSFFLWGPPGFRGTLSRMIFFSQEALACRFADKPCATVDTASHQALASNFLDTSDKIILLMAYHCLLLSTLKSGVSSVLQDEKTGTGISECCKWEVCVQLELVGGMYRGEEKCHVWLENKGLISTVALRKSFLLLRVLSSCCLSSGVRVTSLWSQPRLYRSLPL